MAAPGRQGRAVSGSVLGEVVQCIANFEAIVSAVRSIERYCAEAPSERLQAALFADLILQIADQLCHVRIGTWHDFAGQCAARRANVSGQANGNHSAMNTSASNHDKTPIAVKDKTCDKSVRINPSAIAFPSLRGRLVVSRKRPRSVGTAAGSTGD